MAEMPARPTDYGAQKRSANAVSREPARKKRNRGGAELGPGTAAASRAPVNNNDRMHPRNPYRGKDPNHEELARQYPELKQYLRPAMRKGDRPALALTTNPAAAIAYNGALLKRDFGIQWTIPVGRLCPPIASRINYILWLQDLIKLNRPTGGGVERVLGIDIGTGANVIYPLLGTAMDSKWNFIATDVDETALSLAKKNLDANPQLQERIKLTRVTSDARVQAALPPGDSSVDFCMCNPPFFESALDVRVRPDGRTAGTRSELVCQGGELGFVSGIVRESATLRGKVRWYTSMFGKKASVKAILKLLRESGFTNIVTTEFLQGRTTRWGIAWCSEPRRAAEAALRLAVDSRARSRRSAAQKAGSAAVNAFCVPYVEGKSVIGKRISDFVDALSANGGPSVKIVSQTSDATVGSGVVHMTIRLTDTKAPTAAPRAAAPASLIDISMRVGWQGSRDAQTNEMSDAVVVSLDRANPPNLGRAEFEKLSVRLANDLQRTNRRWRRLLARRAREAGGAAQ